MKNFINFTASAIIAAIVFMPFFVTLLLAIDDSRWLAVAIPYFIVALLTDKYWLPTRFYEWLNK